MTTTEPIELEYLRHLEEWLKDAAKTIDAHEHRIDLLVARQQWLEKRVTELEKERVMA